MPYVSGSKQTRRFAGYQGFADDTPRESPVVTAWRAQVAMLKPFYKTASGAIKQEQATVTRLGSGPYRGQLAYRYRAPQQTTAAPQYLYTRAPDNVQAADAADTAAYAALKQSGANQQQYVDAIKSVFNAPAQVLNTIAQQSNDAGKKTREALGLPGWLIPALLAGAGYVAVRTILR